MLVSRMSRSPQPDIIVITRHGLMVEKIVFIEVQANRRGTIPCAENAGLLVLDHRRRSSSDLLHHSRIEKSEAAGESAHVNTAQL